MIFKTDDVRITGIQEVIAPRVLHEELPLNEQISETVFHARSAIHHILHGDDDRLVVVVGPCSVHDPDAAREYASRLKKLMNELNENLCIIMRVYFEKPRTTVGWKGLINDPDLDESFQINKGLKLARQLLLDLAQLGVPTGTEFLDLISPQYIADLVSWGAIGARTTESQGHRELASGLSCPVGFKNGTDGGFKVAIDAVKAASHPHVFMSLTKEGRSGIFSTKGNKDCHIILRGGKQPNYDTSSIQYAVEKLEKYGIKPQMMVDCSHANSHKDFRCQRDVCQNVAQQISSGETHIMGVMLESNLLEGRQDVTPDQPLAYGQSITDACMSWENTENCLRELADAVKQRRKLIKT